jgi:hypothetical protein
MRSEAMSASELPWSEWRDAVITEAEQLDRAIEARLSDRIHPSGRQCIDEWRQELRDAASRGDLIEVRRLARMCRHRVQQELRWYEENLMRMPRTFLPYDDEDAL